MSLNTILEKSSLRAGWFGCGLYTARILRSKYLEGATLRRNVMCIKKVNNESDVCVFFHTYPNEHGELDPFTIIRQDLERVGIASETSRTKLLQHAVIEELSLTVLSVYFVKQFFSTFVSEAAKDAYALLKTGFMNLWSEIFGCANSPKVNLVTADGPVSTEFSVKFSLWAETESGRVKLLFPVHCEEEEFKRTIELFLDMMMSYNSGGTLKGLSLDEERNSTMGVVCVVYENSTDDLKIYNPVSGRR